MRLGPLEERDFRLFFAGQTISLLGTGMAGVAISFAVLDLSGSVSDLGFVLAAQTVAEVAFLLVGGAVADRFSRRAVMATSDAVAFAAQGLTAALVLVGAVRLWELIALQALLGASSSFFLPAASGLLPRLAGAGRLRQANALRTFAGSVGALAGPALAGVLVVAVGPGWALAADAASFGASCVLLLAMAAAHERFPRRSLVRGLREGWEVYRRARWLVLWNVNATAINVLAVAPFYVLGPAVAARSLGGAGAWATIVACYGAGGIGGSLVALRVRARRPASVGIGVTVLFAPLLALTAAEAPTAAIAAVAVLTGAAGALRRTLAQTTAQERFAPEMLSRVSSYGFVASAGLAPAGYALAGVLAAHVLGVGGTLWLAAAVALAASLGIAAAPSVRRVEAAAA